MPSNGFVHGLEFFEVGFGFFRRNPDGFFARGVASGVDAINAHVHQRASARQFAVEPPLWATNFETKIGIDVSNLTQFARFAQPHQLAGERLEVQAVANVEFHPRFFTDRHHFFGFFHADAHGFFANDVLTQFGRSQHKLVVQAVGQSNIHRVNVRILGDLLEVFVAVKILFVEAIFRSPLVGFGGRARYAAHEFGHGAVAQGIGHALGITSQTNHGYAQHLGGRRKSGVGGIGQFGQQRQR